MKFFFRWLLIGVQSFGGGSSTFSIIHKETIHNKWMTEDEFVRSWALVQISPGINLIKLTVLIGYKLLGWSGIFAAVSGLLFPSATITVLMTAGYSFIKNIGWIQAVMKGIIPAAIGLSFAMCVQMAEPIFLAAKKEGYVLIVAYAVVLLLAAFFLWMYHFSPVYILLAAGVISTFIHSVYSGKKTSVQ